MKKFFIFLGVLVGIVAVAVLILGVIEPTDVVVSRNVIIKAPKEAVFEQMVLFKNWPNWSPWYKMEPNSQMTYFGTDGRPGSGYSWVGDKTGAGTMTNDSVNGAEMDFEVQFTKPNNGLAHGVLKAEDSAGYTKATWSFSMHMPYPMNAMGIFMNMDKLLGGDFESGLSNMKRYVESHVESSTAIDIEQVIYPARVFEGVRQKVGWNEMDKFYADNSAMLKKEVNDRISGSPVQLLMGWDTSAKTGDIVAAYPVIDSSKPAVKGAQYIYVPESRSYRVMHRGAYDKMPGIHVALQKFIAEQKQSTALIFEEYVVGPMGEPDTSKWVTNIFYLIK